MVIDVKKILLNLGEENLKVLVKEVIRPLGEDYIKKSPNKVDDVILPFLDQVEKAILELADKVDGEVG